MRFTLEVTSGQQAGLQIPVTVGGVPLTIGRSRAAVVFADDATMSGLHFEISCDGNQTVLKNFSQTNGTFVNELRVEQVFLKANDLVRAGKTTFRLVPQQGDEPQQLVGTKIACWLLGWTPPDWEIIEGKGLRFLRDGVIVTTIIVTEEPLPKDHDLAKYLDIQTFLIQKRLPEATFQKADAQVKGAEEGAALNIQSALPDGRKAVQRQLYATSQGQVGILTATAFETEVPEIHEAIERVLAGATLFVHTGTQVEERSTQH